MFAANLYKYTVSAYISNDTQYVQLGCFLRTRHEWEADFWNNPEKSNARLRAFKVACAFLDELTKTQNEK